MSGVALSAFLTAANVAAPIITVLRSTSMSWYMHYDAATGLRTISAKAMSDSRAAPGGASEQGCFREPASDTSDHAVCPTDVVAAHLRRVARGSNRFRHSRDQTSDGNKTRDARGDSRFSHCISALNAAKNHVTQIVIRPQKPPEFGSRLAAGKPGATLSTGNDLEKKWRWGQPRANPSLPETLDNSVKNKEMSIFQDFSRRAARPRRAQICGIFVHLSVVELAPEQGTIREYESEFGR